MAITSPGCTPPASTIVDSLRLIQLIKRSESMMVLSGGVEPGEIIAMADPTATDKKGRATKIPGRRDGRDARGKITMGLSHIIPELKMGLASLFAHKLRSLLTMLGMIFGVGAVVAMLSITAGARKK